ncbi:hypothetical protein MBLNU457_1932t1 [Dothideomycetes sp. NU457]
MTSHVFVVDSSARRHQIKTTPSKTLRDILEEACEKFGKDPDQFILTDASKAAKPFDLSRSIRLAGLANGAKLQLVQASRSPTVLSVALQLPQVLGGGRIQDKFPSNTSLWQVLRKFEEAVAGDPPKKLNITQRGVPSTDNGSGRLEYEQPVLNVMNRELKDFVDLQKTLMQLGFNSGGVMVRLDFRRSGTPMEEAMKQISEYFAASQPQSSAHTATPAARTQSAAPTEPMEVETTAAHGAHAAAEGNMHSVPDVDAENAAVPLVGSADREPPGDTIMTPPPASSEAQKPHEETGLIASSSEGPITNNNTTSEPSQPSSSTTSGPQISVYAPSSNTTPQAALQPYNEADYLPSIEHAQSHQNTLNRASQNRRLASDAEMAKDSAEKAEVLAAVKSATVRVRFPDQMQVDLTIQSSETAESLYATVRDMLERPALGFELRYRSSKFVPLTLPKGSTKKIIADLGLVGNTLLTMAWDTGVPLEAREPVLKQSVRAQAKELKVPMVEDVAPSKSSGGVTLAQKSEKKRDEGKKGDLESKMKKFLGFKK